MATVTTEGTRLSALPPPSGRAGLIGTLRSEFTKIRSVRSTYWTHAGPVRDLRRPRRPGHRADRSALEPGVDQATRATFDPTRNSLVGLYFGQFVIVVLGALTITSEYSTGMIRTALTAMPRRGIFYVAKALVFTAVALVIGEVTSFVAFFLGQALLSSQHIQTTLGAPNVLRAVIGGGLFIAVTGCSRSVSAPSSGTPPRRSASRSGCCSWCLSS